MIVDSDNERARREAAEWRLWCDEEPDDAHIQRRFQDWLRASPENARAWDEMTRTNALLSNRATVVALPARRKIRPTRRTMAVGLAAMAATLVFICAPRLTLWLQADYITGTAQIRSITLADGSRLTLGPQTAIQVALGKTERHVRMLSGEAFFDVTHDTSRPFRVQAAHATTSVLGTRFDVDDEKEVTIVSVTSGHVLVENGHGNAVHLQHGDRVHSSSSTISPVEHDLAAEATAAPSHLITVQNLSVADVITKIRPWFGGKIIVLRRGTESTVTGVFDATDPAKALRAVVSPQGGRVIRMTPWFLLVLPA